MYAEKSLRTENYFSVPPVKNTMTRDLLSVMKILAEGGLNFLTVAVYASPPAARDALSILGRVAQASP